MSAKLYPSVIDAIGNTPAVRLNKVVANPNLEVFVKLEFTNPGGSIKDRIALAIIENAEKEGKLKPGGFIVEATSGNTGLGLAMVAAVKGYRCVFVMPEKISEEKRAILRAFGAEVIITPNGVEPEDPRSHYSVAKKVVAERSNAVLANQYHNPVNPEQHYKTTGPEIWAQMDGNIDAFVAGAGTGGTISGVGKFLKEKNPKIQIVLADPVGSILYDLVMYGQIRTEPKPYLVEGVGEDMIPNNFHKDYIDAAVQVNDQEAFAMTRRLIAEEGLCVGPSSGLNLVAALKWAETHSYAKRVMVVFPDSGRAYLSKAFNETWLKENNLL